MADDELLAGALKGLQETAAGGGEIGTTATAGPAADAANGESPLPKKLYRHQSHTVGDRLINTYVADRSSNSPKLTRQGFCVGFAGSYAEPRVRMLLDNGQQITVPMSSVHKVSEKDAVFEGDPADREIWMADFAEDVKKGDLKRVVTELHRRATKIRKRIKQERKEQQMERQQQQQQQKQQKKRQKAVDTADTTSENDNTAGGADSNPAAAADAEAPSTSASTELTTEQKRERLALKRKRLELEVAQKKLAAAQAKASNAQKRSLLHKKKEQEQALTLAVVRSRQPTPVPGEEVSQVSKQPPRKKRKLTDLAALRRPSILVDNISSSGPSELVYIQPRKQCSNNDTDNSAEAKTRLPTPQREEKKSELQKRQRAVLERRAELLRKAEMLKQKQQEKRKSLDAEGDNEDDNDGGAGSEGGNIQANDDGENRKAAGNDMNEDTDIRSGAASEAENDGADSGEEIDQMEQLRLRRLELQSAISQQAQTQTELKQSIEVQNLRGMVRTQLGVLTKQGQNLSERTAQLKQCTADIEAERKEVEDAEQRLEELLEKKRRLESMAGTVTNRLLESRKKKAEILKGRVIDDGGGPDAAAGGPQSRSRSRSPRQGGRQSRSKRNKGGAAADFF